MRCKRFTCDRCKKESCELPYTFGVFRRDDSIDEVITCNVPEKDKQITYMRFCKDCKQEIVACIRKEGGSRTRRH